jgi:tRNA dimethylallyltransferase
MDLNPVFIGGPTAAGKSELALHLAERVGGEIISVDSMQVYRGLDVGTAKPSAVERERVPHHLIDVCELGEQFDAAQFVCRAKTAVADIQSRERVPIFCGGTGLYFKAFLKGLGTSPATSETLRAELEQLPLEQLLAELKKADPIAFEKIDRHNQRRVVRAIEVIRLTGQPFSAQRADWKTAVAPVLGDSSETERAPRFFCFTRSRADLQKRIDARAETMFAKGLVAETDWLLKNGLEKNRTAMQAIGYRQVVEFLRGERSLPETMEQVKIRTRQFAKRQLSWFRAQDDLRWIELVEQETPTMTLEKLGFAH